MGVEYNQLGEECESRKESHKRGNLYGLGQQFLAHQVLCMGRKEERKKESLELVQPWRVNSESVTGANWSWRTEEPGCQA
jgi:hypothetical protein